MFGDENADFQRYFRGEALIGDDYDEASIAAWYADEAEGYASLGPTNRNSYVYCYHALNQSLGFSNFRKERFEKVLGIGSAYGDEFLPIVERVRHITILDPSDKFFVTEVGGVPVDCVKPEVTGTMSFGDNSFDLVTCLGVLHHIPNVTYVMSEAARVLQPGGNILIREPVVNMGDWRKPRHGLTQRERGIPMSLMERAIKQAGLTILHRTPCALRLCS